MHDGRKGADRWKGLSWLKVLIGGSGGAGEKDSLMCVVSSSRSSDNESGCNHGGGIMFARLWRFSRRANHKGSRHRCGGMSA